MAALKSVENVQIMEGVPAEDSCFMNTTNNGFGIRCLQSSYDGGNVICPGGSCIKCVFCLLNRHFEFLLYNNVFAL